MPRFCLMAAFVVVSQLKINVMNAYAGSLAWSNFFSRLTHSHPGRVVWLMFNVAIALLLMELGIYKLLEETLGLFSIIAMAWLCTISADLFINKPLGLAPPNIEFKRAHLYDINPVGTGAMTASALIALTAHFGVFGAHGSLACTLYRADHRLYRLPRHRLGRPKGKYYLARKPRQSWKKLSTVTCSICEHPFEPEDMAWCPAYSAPICSLCCSLDSRCHDMCKPHASFKRPDSRGGQGFAPAKGDGNAVYPARPLWHRRRAVGCLYRHHPGDDRPPDRHRLARNRIGDQPDSRRGLLRLCCRHRRRLLVLCARP